MTLVSDPNLIAQLEGSSKTPGPMTPVSDPRLLSQLEGAQPTDNSLVGRLANNPLTNSILGAGDAVRNTMSGAANLLPGVNIPDAQSSSGTAYNVGKFGGNIAAFMGGGEALDAARGAAEALPYAGQLAKALSGGGLSGVARRAIGSGAYGAATNANDQTGGAEQGAGMSLAFDTLPPAFKLAAAASRGVRPQAYAEQLMQGLSGGRSLEDNAKSLAQDIQGAAKQQEAAGNALYSPIFSAHGDSSIYNGLNPSNSAYQDLDKNILNKYDYDLKDLHKTFVENPTLQNAHELQSQLGSSIRNFQKMDSQGTLDIASRNAMQAQQRAQSALRGDMNTFLDGQQKGLADQYDAARENWATNVSPYLENTDIAKIASGKITNPSNITSIFKNPEPSIQKVVSDLPPDASSKILYSELGKLKSNLTPERLAKAFTDLDNKGLGSYMDQGLHDSMDTLQSRINKRNWLQKGAGFLAAGSMMPHMEMGGLPVAEILGGAMGSALIPPTLKMIQQRLPMQQLRDALVASGKIAYPPTRTAALANMLPQNQQ